MNPSSVEQLVNAVLYEGYILYPYRPSSKKNQRERFTFGRVYPSACSAALHGSERCMIQTECLLHCPKGGATLEVSVRFLQPVWREIGVIKSPLNGSSDGKEPEYRPVRELVVGGRLYQSWQEAVEREVKVPPISTGATESQSPIANGKWPSSTVSHPFAFPASRTFEALSEDATGRAVGVIVRRQEAVEGMVEVKASPVGAQCSKITVRILNQTPVPETARGDQDAIILRTFASTHTILQARDGEFISLTDHPDALQDLVNDCKNVGTWPVLAGDEAAGQRDTMLSSPIILYDYPKIAPESNGDFFDGTEIDEMLALRVMTMTDDEKREMGGADGLARKLLERTESFSPEHWMDMHGTMRDVKAVEEFFNPPQAAVTGMAVKRGDKVRLRPRSRADALDMILAGKTAIVESVEQDVENKVHVAVVLEDDPGKDLGLMRQPGHRFFYGLDEVEPLGGGCDMKRILVAGLGNIFHGDDAFGVEVARALVRQPLPDQVTVEDFGIQAYDLAFALTDRYDAIILVDAMARGQTPGTVSLLEPDVSGADAPKREAVDAHTMDPVAVLRMAETLGGVSGKLFLVGCEPAVLECEGGEMGLSQAVQAAVPTAVAMIESLAHGLLDKNQNKSPGWVPA